MAMGTIGRERAGGFVCAVFSESLSRGQSLRALAITSFSARFRKLGRVWLAGDVAVQNLRIKIHVVGPDNGSEIGVDFHLCEEGFVLQRLEHAALADDPRSEIEAAADAVGEDQLQLVVVQVSNGFHVWEHSCQPGRC